MIVEISYVLSLLALLILERIINALSQLIYSMTNREEKDSSSIKGYASMQLVGSVFTFLSSVVSATISVLAGALSGFLSIAFWCTVIAILFSTLYVLLEYYPTVFLELVAYWNDPIGPILHTAVILPLELVNSLFVPVVGLYNMFVWIAVQLWKNLILAEVMHDFEEWKSIGTGTVDFVKHLVLETVSYVKDLAEVCPASDGDLCYAPGRRMFDFITPANDARIVSKSVMAVGMNLCSTISGPLEISRYPWLDINFAKGFHLILNAALFTMIQVPTITILRCTRNPGIFHHPHRGEPLCAKN
jgi:hypothetical protein